MKRIDRARLAHRDGMLGAVEWAALSVRQQAERLGLPLSSWYRRRQLETCPTTGEAAVREWLVTAGAPGSGSGPGPGSSKERWELARARQKELEVEELEGRLVSAARVKADAVAETRALALEVEDMGARIVARCPVDAREEIKVIVSDEVGALRARMAGDATGILDQVVTLVRENAGDDAAAAVAFALSVGVTC